VMAPRHAARRFARGTQAAVESTTGCRRRGPCN
jgi:hypothetical protein